MTKELKSILLILVTAIIGWQAFQSEASEFQLICKLDKDGTMISNNPYACMRELNKKQRNKSPFRNAGLINLKEEVKHNG